MIRLFRFLRSLVGKFMQWEFRREAYMIFALWCVIVAIRFLGPFNLTDQDQERPAAYMMDILRYNEWICQRDVTGDITSKPPLYTWLGALFSLPFGTVNRLTLYLPCMLSVLFSALLVLWRGGKHFGRQAGFWGAVALVASLPAIKMVSLARTDPLFMLVVFATGLMAFECWSRHRNWSYFWVLASLGTLTKGPLGLILGALGLFAIVWERMDKRQPAGGGLRWDQHLEGLFAFVVLCAGWFWLAVRELGQPVLDKMLGAELERHIVRGDQGELPFQNVLNPFFYFLGRYAPWSLATLLGTGLSARVASEDDHARRFERFCMVALFGGILLFSFAGHKRPDHLFPLLPFAAILAGRGLAWLRVSGIGIFRIAPAAAAAVMISYSAVYYIWGERNDERIVETRRLKDFAQTVKDAGNPPLVYTGDMRYSLQFFLNEMCYDVSTSAAVRLLNGSAPVFVAVGHPARNLKLLRDSMTTPSRFNEVVKKDYEAPEDALVIISNQPEFKNTGRVAFNLWDLDVVTSNAVVSYAERRRKIVFKKVDQSKPARASLGNYSGYVRDLEIDVFGRPDKISLSSGETWSVMVR